MATLKVQRLGMRYLTGLQQEGVIESFEPVFLDLSGAMLEERMTTWVANIPR